MSLPVLSLVVFVPWIGALLLAILPRIAPAAARTTALAFSLSTLVLGVLLALRFDPAVTTYQFVEQGSWVRALNVSYHLGLDGLSLLLVLLTGIIGPAAAVASWKSAANPRLFGILYLVLQGSALGVFLALDFFHWFVFWELSLIPAFFLIRFWGGPHAGPAAYQFVIYTIGGSAFMLLGFAGLFASTGTLDFVELTRIAQAGGLADIVGPVAIKAIFLGILLGLAVKVPLFPFHTWLPTAYAEAPVGVSMFLTGIMSKMGLYGFLRILWPLFPAELEAASTVLIPLALAGVVLGAFAALAQTDLKRMVAYSSINHLSYCLLAVFTVASGRAAPAGSEAAAAAFSGTLLQMFNHGLSAAALFFCVGLLEARSGGRRGIGDFGGLRRAAPGFAALAGIALFSSLGLPGLNGFVGEFLIFRGVFGFAPGAAAIACLGLLATALFLLTFWLRVFHGPRAGVTVSKFARLDAVDLAPLVPIACLMIVLGVFPQILAGLINPLVTTWAGHLAP